MTAKPLEGFRVLDLSRLIPGPMASLHLADLGAEVIKVEDTGAGDYMRRPGPDAPMSALFGMVNRNKKSIALDLKQPEAVEAFLRLAETADVVIESFRPGVVARLGIDFAAVRARNSRIVYAALSGYGQTGPFAEKAGHDINYLGYAGILDQIGAAEGPPVLANWQIADLAGGALSTAMAILAALLGVQRGGEGRYLDIAMTDCAMAHGVVTLAAIAERGHVTARGRDRLSGGLPGYRVYACADGRHLAVGALEPKFWEAFCQAIDRPDLAAKGRTPGPEAEEVAAEVAAALRTRERNEWAVIFDRIDCCVSPVLSLEEAMETRQALARGLVRHDPLPDGGETLSFNFPVLMSDFTTEIRLPPPEQGADTDAVLGALGLDVEALRASGAAG